jgi:hypothetical protein
VQQYSAELVPGLFQTPDYARTLIREDNPGVEDAEIDRRVHVRMARQALLTRLTSPVTMEVALNEVILRRPVGGREVMAAQLERLLELAALPHISIRVVPYDAGLHHGLLSGSFTMLRFPLGGDGKPTEPPTVYVGGFTGDLYLDKPNEIERYDGAFQAIWGSCLDDEETERLIHQATRELRQ